MAAIIVNLNRRNVVAVNVRRLLRVVHEDAPSALLMVGVWTSSTAVRAAATAPPGWVGAISDDGVEHAYCYYMGTVAGAFVGGVFTMWAAVWVSAANARRRVGAGQWILCAALVPLAVALGLSDAELLFSA